MIHYCKGEYGRDGICLDPTAPAFRYGTGFFETICHNGRSLCHLDRHLDRLLHALRAFGIEYETIDFPEVIDQVINRNGLQGKPARVNIFYPVEADMAHPVVLAAPHVPKPYKAYRLCICNDRHVSTLNAHKTTNYMFFNLAMRQAAARGFDDAALIDFEGNLLESTIGALVFEKGGEYFCTDSAYRLASTTLDIAREVLDITPRVIRGDDLEKYRHAYILNSLIGMRPVVTIGEMAFVPDAEVCERVSGVVLG